jgi:hypothetical protein
VPPFVLLFYINVHPFDHLLVNEHLSDLLLANVHHFDQLPENEPHYDQQIIWANENDEVRCILMQNKIHHGLLFLFWIT